MLPPQSCLVTEDVCCTSLFDIANHILAGVYEAMLECYQPSFCNAGGLIAYVTMGSGDDLVVDALTVSIGGVQPTQNSLQANSMTPMAAYQATFDVRIIESGWPMAEEMDGEIYPPDPALQNALARHAYAHGERMYRKLAYMTKTGDLTPDGVTCSKAVLLPLRPMNPAGGTVGWWAQVQMILPWVS